MRLQNIIYTIAFFAILMTLSACKGGVRVPNINLFPLSDDIALGEQVSKQIESDTKQFPILAEQGNEELYRYVRGITRKILNSGRVKHKDDFKWQIKIIDDVNTLNAFCTPGGYIYVYTGLIKFLDSEDQLAGVMGHEIAHADLRHSTRQMTKVYGVQTMLSVVTGKADPGLMEQIALSIINLKFSRGHETESDNNSVHYLCGTSYNAAGAAGFFEKIQQQGGGRPPAFMSTHPNPENRVENIHAKAAKSGCTGKSTNQAAYEKIKRLIK